MTLKYWKPQIVLNLLAKSDESEEIGDTFVDVLASISHRTPSTEIVIVPEAKDNDRMNYFLGNSLSQQRRVIIKIKINTIKSTKSFKKLHKL